jgi:lysophospholipase L1-like esterase
MQNRKKRILQKVLLMISALFLTLTAVEMILRFFYPIDYRMPPPHIPDDVWRAFLHRASPIPGLAYELVPNREKYSHGAVVKTNSWGMRDDEPLPKNDRSVHRIAVLGDSFTFGFGVSGEDTYPNVLERLLNKEIKGGKHEVLNFGVGGYSTRDEALVLRHKALDWNPDLVIVGYFLNDPEVDPVQPLHAYYQKTSWWQHVNLLRLIAKAKHRLDVRIYGGGDDCRYLYAPTQPQWQGMVEALGEIAGMAAERKIPVLLIIFPMTMDKPWADYPYRDLHRQLEGAAERMGIHVIDLYETYRQYPGRVLMVDSGDSHPSKTAHEVTADVVYRWISANKEEVFGSSHETNVNGK